MIDLFPAEVFVVTGYAQRFARVKLVKGFELMQFTGLTDKNGREIYEGDIFQEKTKNPKTGKRVPSWCVVWKDGMFTDEFGDKTLGELLRYSLEIEVLGNIYENPELLK